VCVCMYVFVCERKRSVLILITKITEYMRCLIFTSDISLFLKIIHVYKEKGNLD